MIDRAVHPADRENLGTVPRCELARSDAVAEAAGTVLRQLVASSDSLPLTDEVVARIRGMLEGIADALLEPLSDTVGLDAESLLRALIDAPALLRHLHATAIEWRMTERLHRRLALDPVVSPLLEELVAHDDVALRDLAAKFATAQARWCHSQRDMRLALTELPREVFRAVLAVLLAQADQHPAATQAEAQLSKRYDEAAGRLDLGRQLVSRLQGGAQAALSIGHSGVALFLTALALGSGQDREAVARAIEATQFPRLALALRSAGLGLADVERQMLTLHPEITMPRGFEALDPNSAAALLNSGPAGT